MIEVVNATPVSLLARRFRTTNATATTGATERQVMSLPAVNVIAGRLYRISAPNFAVYGSAASGYAIIYLRVTTDGSVPTSSSSQLTQTVMAMPTAGIGYTGSVTGFYSAGVNGTLRVALSYGGSSGNNATMAGAATFPVTLFLEHVGIDPGQTGIDS